MKKATAISFIAFAVLLIAGVTYFVCRETMKMGATISGGKGHIMVNLGEDLGYESMDECLDGYTLSASSTSRFGWECRRLVGPPAAAPNATAFALHDFLGDAKAYSDVSFGDPYWLHGEYSTSGVMEFAAVWTPLKIDVSQVGVNFDGGYSEELTNGNATGSLAVSIYNASGERVINFTSPEFSSSSYEREVTSTIPQVTIGPGIYYVAAAFTNIEPVGNFVGTSGFEVRALTNLVTNPTEFPARGSFLS